MRTQTVEVCADRQLHWVLAVEEPRCVDTHHDHRLIELHQHLDRVVLPNNTAITAVSFAPERTYRRDEEPGFGLLSGSPVDSAVAARPSRVAGLRCTC